MDSIEKRARELLAVVLHEMYPDDAGKRYVIDKLLVDELDLVSARGAIRALIAALTPPEGYVLVPVEPTAEMISAAWRYGDGDDAPDPVYSWRAMLTARPEVP
ncbi:hypothetical protein [Stenotrophomonas maltophilia]|jgi:hypothetical protein|uniref:hypothetical protein n=1 Tax=Stenotrophomonas maltophilia TaxID=40324 RepID=UPI0035BCAE6A